MTLVQIDIAMSMTSGAWILCRCSLRFLENPKLYNPAGVLIKLKYALHKQIGKLGFP